MAVKPLARIIRVVLRSVPDMANILALILFFMLVFSVFGVTLFGSFVPEHFQNMQVALYTLFICITQDGWVDIYNDFQEKMWSSGIRTCRWCTARWPVWRCLAFPKSRLWGAPCPTSRKVPATTSVWCSRQYRRT